MAGLPDLPLFPERASAAAGQVDTLFFVLLGVTGTVGALVVCVLIFFCVKYRRRSE